MELHQLRYVVAVADAGSFTAAAQALHVSQSGVSAQVARLERELGVTVFDRGSRSATETAAGAALVAQMRVALAAVEDVRTTASQTLGLLRGRVRIGTVAGLIWSRFLDAVQAVRAQHPALEIVLREGQSDDVQQQVLDGRLDVAVVSWAREPLAALSSWVSVHERVSAVVSTDHAWARRRVIRPAELVGSDVICMVHGTGMRAAYEAMMRDEGLAAPATWEVTLPTTVRALAGRGLGVGVVTSSDADPPDDLVHLRIRSAHARSMLGVVWRSQLRVPPATAAVLDALRAHLGPDGNDADDGSPGRRSD